MIFPNICGIVANLTFFPDVSAATLILPNLSFVSARTKIKIEWFERILFRIFPNNGFQTPALTIFNATKACLLNRTATIQPTMPFALDVQKFEKKICFFSTSPFLDFLKPQDISCRLFPLK